MQELYIEKLRRDLIEYFGSAMAFNPVSIVNLTNVENASSEELIQIAIDNKFELDKYVK